MNKEGTGLASNGIDTGVEYVTLQQEQKRYSADDSRESTIGLGYRVPLVIASPWSRGGVVNSQVFDHTSILQFLEKFLSHKTGKKIEETNISNWRRTVCGDLTSVFKPYQGEEIKLPSFLEKDDFIEGVHKARFKKDPSGYKALNNEEIAAINKDIYSLPLMPRQEKGTRESNALPYQLYADGALSADKQSFTIHFAARNEVFGSKAAGSPFMVYTFNQSPPRAYAVKAGDTLKDTWSLEDFEQQRYHLAVHGPNGFLREFTGNSKDPQLAITCDYEVTKKVQTGNIVLTIKNQGTSPITITLHDHTYGSKDIVKAIAAKSDSSITVNLSKSYNWYDFSIYTKGYEHFSTRYAGRVETGKPTLTDPAIGK